MLISSLENLFAHLPGLTNGPISPAQNPFPNGFWIGLALTAVGVLGLLVAEKTNWQWARWTFKPLACLGFLLAGWFMAPFGSGYGVCVFVGLVLSVVGDLCLIPQGSGKVFLGGVAAFLLAHVAYTVAFFFVGISPMGALVAAVPMIAIALGVYRWLRPDVPAQLQKPILGYVVVITAMVTLSIGVAVQSTDLMLMPVAATLFWLSDISVARDRFKQAGFFNKFWGLPFYFGAQLLFAVTILMSAA